MWEGECRDLVLRSLEEWESRFLETRILLMGRGLGEGGVGVGVSCGFIKLLIYSTIVDITT